MKRKSAKNRVCFALLSDKFVKYCQFHSNTRMIIKNYDPLNSYLDHVMFCGKKSKRNKFMCFEKSKHLINESNVPHISQTHSHSIFRSYYK